MKTTTQYFSYYLKPYILQLFIVIVALLITAGSILSFGLVLRHIIDSSSNNVSFYNFIPAVAIVCIFSIASFIRSYSIYAICEKVICKVRQDAYKHLINIPPYHFEIRQTSDIISRLMNDSLIVAESISDTFSFALRNTITAIGCGILMLYISPKLGLYILSLIPILVLMIVYIGKKIKKISRQNQEEISSVSANVEETFNAIKTIQSFNFEEHKISFFNKLSNDVLFSNLSRLQIRSMLSAAVIFLILSGILIIAMMGLNEIAAKTISVGDLTSFIFYALTGAISLGGITDIAGNFQRSVSAAERLFSLLDIAAEDSNNNLKRKKLSSYNIKFQNVYFSYPSRKSSAILNNLSLEIKSGEFVGIVGKSGCGKTTIISLLEKFYKYNEGEISIGGTNINNIPNKQIREILAIVPQDHFIFSASIKENILLGNINAKDSEISHAIKQAGIYDFINSLPDNLDTYVGEKGVMLSGGQKQRIVIARALLKKPKILLLDEATSALDSMHEEEVHDAIKNIDKDITIIAIAHRISTIKEANKIIVMENGEIKDIGTHSKLLKDSKTYRELATEI